MNIPRPVKLVLFLLTMVQPLYMIAFFALVATGSAVVPFPILMNVHMAVMFASMALLLFYIVHLFRTDRVTSDKRALWGITLFCAAPVAMPVYFIKHVWPSSRV